MNNNKRVIFPHHNVNRLRHDLVKLRGEYTPRQMPKNAKLSTATLGPKLQVEAARALLLKLQSANPFGSDKIET